LEKFLENAHGLFEELANTLKNENRKPDLFLLLSSIVNI
jgi:hypothetical protein